MLTETEETRRAAAVYEAVVRRSLDVSPTAARVASRWAARVHPEIEAAVEAAVRVTQAWRPRPDSH